MNDEPPIDLNAEMLAFQHVVETWVQDEVAKRVKEALDLRREKGVDEDFADRFVKSMFTDDLADSKYFQRNLVELLLKRAFVEGVKIGRIRNDLR